MVIIICAAIIAIAIVWLAWRVENLRMAVRKMDEECRSQYEKIKKLGDQILALKSQRADTAPCVVDMHPMPAPQPHGQTKNTQTVGIPCADVFYLAQNQEDIFVNFNSSSQPGSLFKAVAVIADGTAEYEPVSLNFLQCSDHFKAVSLTADSCLIDEATTFETVTPGLIEKSSESGHTFWEIKRRVLVRLAK